MTRTRAIALAVLAVVVVAAAFAVAAWRESRILRNDTQAAASHLQNGEWDEAERSLRSLQADSQRALQRLRGPLPAAIGHVPFVGRSVRTVEAMLEAGAEAARLAVRALPVVRNQSFGHGGALDLAPLRPFRLTAQQLRPGLDAARTKLDASPSWPLPPPLAKARRELVERLASASRGLEASVVATDLTERILGAPEVRRYFILFENPAEMRGAGGFWGNYGILEAQGGKLRLGRFGRTADDLGSYATKPGPAWYETRYARFAASHDWRAMPTAPDFPTVASIAEADLEGAAGLGPVDGTIAIDPVGLSALLHVTGPVSVASWPTPITAANVVEVTLHRAYGYFDNRDQRAAFLGDTAFAVWSRLLSSDLSLRAMASSGLGGTVEQKHLKLHFVRPDEQRLVQRLGAEGGVGNGRSTFALVTQNTAGTKMDYWLRRDLDLDVRLRNGGSADVTAVVTLRNRGPASGEPSEVIGPYQAKTTTKRFKAGWNYQLVRLYVPGDAAVQHMQSRPPIIATEQGFTVFEWNVAIPPGGHVQRRVSFHVDSAWDTSTRSVDLRLRRQQFLAPDTIRVGLRPPRGAHIVLTTQCWGEMSADLTLRGAVRRSLRGWVLTPWTDVTCG